MQNQESTHSNTNNEEHKLAYNSTINTLLNRRSIRAFKNEPISEEIVNTLELVAQRAACSQFLNDWSAIKITNPEIKQKLSEIGNQAYIATTPLLYVFVIDQHRNAVIARKNGIDTESSEFTLKTGYRFCQSQNDAILALHAMETAAESLGLGCVILGSILNNISELIELLKLPKYTYPVLGLAIGKPDQAPDLKPRMDPSMQFFENEYPSDNNNLIEKLVDFDARVHKYYDLRNASRPVDAFSAQIVKLATDSGAKNHSCETQLNKQGFTFKI
ncbi:nitroreductase family protein [uncultured Gardnerella sp.]|uniref:nitroreductase family protein n=1 Tax=uncultured Gardnerella sp. TaxID=293424 RepID=UPI00261EA642|nr:nitroreductase family protein [uncultured Gardnerella sp.]